MLAHVSARLEIPVASLLRTRRDRGRDTRVITYAHWAAMRAMRDRRVTLHRIAETLGVDHTTVLHGLRRFETLAATDLRYGTIASETAQIGMHR